jgi:hypothetical protein
MKPRIIFAGMMLIVAASAAPAQTNTNAMLAPGPKSMELDIAWRAYLDATNLGLMAEESVKSTGTFTLGRDVDGLGKKGDQIMEVQVRHLNQEVRGLILVNLTTRLPMVVFPKKP